MNSTHATHATHEHSPPTHSHPIDRLLRRAEVLEIVGMCAESLRKLENAGTFPGRIKLTGNRRIAYRLADVNRWMESREAVKTPALTH